MKTIPIIEYWKQTKNLTVRNTLGGHKGDTAMEQLQISSSEVKASWVSKLAYETI